MKKKIRKDEQEVGNKNIIINGLDKDKDVEANVKKVFSKLDEENNNYKLSIIPSFPAPQMQ